MEQITNLRKIVKFTGERAKLDAKINDTYVVYSKNGKIVREYADGRIEYVEDNGVQK